MKFLKFQKLLSILLVSGIVIGSMAACSKENQETKFNGEGAKKLGTIQVISREEGSGTRNVFAESIGFLDASTGRDFTTDKAEIATDSQQVKDLIMKDINAIGYVSEGLINNQDENLLHTVTVDGKNLERSFYLTYSGTLTEVEQEFLAYIKSAGREIEENGFCSVKESSQFLSLKPKGNIKIGGSTSMYKLMKNLSESYMQLNPNVTIEVIETDSSNGLTGAMSGIYDFGMSSRDLKDYEKELLFYEEIAKDKIAVIVNQDNPLSNITSKDLKEIYTGEITEWKKLGE